jgi:hypothetical protein
MQNSTYELRYLPLFYEDLNDKVLYIAVEKQTPKAAADLVNKVEKAILDRLPFAESFEPYNSKFEREHAYYRIYVDNYEIYYVVIDENDGHKIMEVRRFLYSRQNKTEIV